MWIYRYYLIVTNAQKDAANALAAGIDPDEGGEDTFSVALGDGNTITHWAANTLATQFISDALIAAMGANPQVAASVAFWRFDKNADWGLRRTKDFNAAPVNVVADYVSFEDAISTLDLQMMEEPV